MMGNLNAFLGPFTQALDLRTHRQQVLASNIANADTPYYKARDFDFKAAYATAMGKREEAGALALTRTNVGHLPMTAGGALDAVNLQYRSEHHSAVDGNTVDMDVERAEITDNALQYQVLTTFLNDRFRGLRSAIASNQGS